MAMFGIGLVGLAYRLGWFGSYQGWSCFLNKFQPGWQPKRRIWPVIKHEK